MIVFDVSALVGAAIKRDGIPELAFRHALIHDRVAVSPPILAECLDVFARPRLKRFLNPELHDWVLGSLGELGIFFEPTEHVADCRDPKDDKYLELALAAGADRIVSSDQDLLVLHPWRGVRIQLLADYLAEARHGA